MKDDILEDLMRVRKELTDMWLRLQKENQSNELYQDFLRKKEMKDPYTLLAINIGFYSGVTCAEQKIREIIDKYKNDFELK